MSSTVELASSVLYRRLLGFVAPYWRVFALAVVAMAVTSALAPIIPALLKPLLDGSFVHKDPRTMVMVPLALIAIAIVRGITGYAGTVATNWVSNRVIMDLRNAMCARLLTLPAAFYDQNSSGEIISRISFDVSQVADASTRVLTVIVRDTMLALGLIGYMVYASWKLALVVFVMAPAIMLVVKSISKRLRRMSRKVQQSMGDVSRVTEEAIACHREIKVYNAQPFEQRRFEQSSNAVRRFAMKAVGAAAANTPVVQIVVALGLAVVIYVAARQAAADELTVGGFVAFFGAMAMLLTPAQRLAGINEHLQRGLAAAESIFGLIDEPPEPDAGTVDIGRASGRIEFRDISFAYPSGRGNALEEISTVIEAGQTVALVGASGSGKSTFVSLVPRFHHPRSGRILLDGVDIEQITLHSLRANIALVSQEVVLFNDTVFNNIAYGEMRGRSETEVVAAAEAAHAMDFIRRMPEGLQTMIGDNGVRLSGGQRQRLAIARALLRDAPILILDEATSSLDSASERHIQQALETLRKGRTCIIIAHRLSTVENADRIIVLKSGKVIEEGTHADLLAHDGVYRRLHRIQFASALAEKAPPAGRPAAREL